MKRAPAFYGRSAVHQGRRAAFHILARYVGADPKATWDDSPRPAGPCGWQWWNTHPEFGATVDRSRLDDWFLGVLTMQSYRNPKAEWLGSPNFELDRDGHDMAIAPSWVVIHTMVGDVPGANARFQHASEQASAHYGVGYDGKLYQWVDEKDAAWHAGNWEVNLDSIGIEHSDMGRYNDPRPDVLYTASATLVREICLRYGVPIAHGDIGRGISGIVPHREVSQTACPDALDWQRIIREAANPSPQPAAPSPTSSLEGDGMIVKAQRADGSADVFYLGPDGTAYHAHELVDHSFDFREALEGEWSSLLEAYWDPDGSLHLRGVGWAGGPLDNHSVPDDGTIDEVVWRNTVWGAPARLV